MAALEGECAGNQFEPTDKAFDNSNQGRVSYVISSWQQFDQLKKDISKPNTSIRYQKTFSKRTI
jgi:hypothetical protein